MSGIFGIFNKDGAPVDTTLLHCMQQAMAHWGRDGKGIWCHGSVGLGHLLMHNTPESCYEQQPYVHPAIPNLVISADSRIDNRKELMDTLCIPCAESTKQPDNELILRAYERWGNACVEGAFAIVIWDGRTQTLLCIRDHVGFRPLYYYDGPQRFVFATDIKAILAVDGVPRRVDELFVFAHHTNSKFYMRGRTAFLDVAKLRPAYTLSLRNNQLEQRPYWFPEQGPEIQLPSNDDYAQHLREHLEQAVACRLRSIHPISSHLSGGLDSSTVTVLAARQLRSMERGLVGVHSWSPPPASDAARRVDEYARIERVCQQEGLMCDYVTLTPETIVAEFSQDISVDPTDSLLYEMVAQPQLVKRSVGVVLSGWGGDEIVSTQGKGYFAELFMRGRWSALLREIRQFTRLQESTFRSVIKSYLLMPLLPDKLYSLLRQDLFPQLRLLNARKQVTWNDFMPGELRLLRQHLRCIRLRPGVKRNQLCALNLGHLAYRRHWFLKG